MCNLIENKLLYFNSLIFKTLFQSPFYLISFHHFDLFIYFIEILFYLLFFCLLNYFLILIQQYYDLISIFFNHLNFNQKNSFNYFFLNHHQTLNFVIRNNSFNKIYHDLTFIHQNDFFIVFFFNTLNLIIYKYSLTFLNLNFQNTNFYFNTLNY